MYKYNLFGLDVTSDLPLPELRQAMPGVPADATVQFGCVEPFEPNVDGTAHHASHDRVLFSYPGVARFRVSDGRDIVVDREANCDGGLVRVCLLGPVFAALLHQRGLLVLHASAVSVSGRATAFIGAKGWGKSTIAASLRTRGCRLLADDVVAIDLSGDVPVVYPGFPQLKLWPASAAVLGLDPSALPRLQRDLEKRAFQCDERFQVEPVPLGAVYVLDLAERLTIERLDRAAAFAELVRHTYLARYLGAAGASVVHFRQCAALVKSVPVFGLMRPVGLELLDDTAAAIERTATSWSSSIS